MNKGNSIIFISLSTILLLAGFSIYISKITNSSKKAYNIINDVKKTKGNQLIYVGSADCRGCVLQQSQIETLIKNYEFNLYYLDLENVSKKKVSNIVNDLGIITNSFDIPSLVIFEEGKYKTMLSGLHSVDEIFDFLQKNSIIKSEEKLKLNYLNYDSYTELLESNETQIIALGSHSVKESNETQTQLWDASKEIKKPINYLMLSNLTEKEGQLFESSLDYFTNNEVGVPTILIVKNKTVISASQDKLDKEGYIKFFKQNGLM